MRIAAISAYEYQRVYGVSSVERSARPYAAFPFRENDPPREERSPSGRAGKRDGSKEQTRRLLPDRTRAAAREAADIVTAFMAIRSLATGASNSEEALTNREDGIVSFEKRLKSGALEAQAFFKTEWKSLLEEAMSSASPNPERWLPIADKLASTPVAALFNIPSEVGLLFEYKF